MICSTISLSFSIVLALVFIIGQWMRSHPVESKNVIRAACRKVTYPQQASRVSVADENLGFGS
jgi:hypothetical protein